MNASTKNHFLSSVSASIFSVISAAALKTIGVIILVGSLIAEVLIILYVPSGASEKLLSALCTAGIVVGILLEEFAVHEISRLEKAPRREILAGKLSLITDALKPFANVSFDAGIGPNDKDVEDFLWDIEPGLWDAGWKQLDWKYLDGALGAPRGNSGRPLVGEAPASNVSIQIHPQSDARLKEAAEAFVAVLKRLGFEAQIDGFNIYNANTDAMHILIGPKR